ncbi:MAG: bifunctional methylenetetrahydrofolate dehydrogenase/methenyltetrahydrofolate cyclohydrolase FolD [Betaproteobacteria bacterium]|nr:MAG: bifunctional methylenetetrahydrofolate dehydrogenase/methenyltetrahydrofolate cyclohydrolase FolD [Betaproteobacteria bacterium]
MTATIIDGRAVSEIMRKKMRSRVESLGLRGLRPGLAVVLVGDDAASQIYVRNKAKACEDVGMHSEVFRYPADTSEADVLQKIAELNEDQRIHGILVQLPLPAHVDNKKVLEAIAPHKDVDGFHKQNVGALVTGESDFPPCTPHGVMALLDHYEVPIEGSNAVVIGRSNIVGKPMALMLLARSATVTICTSKTRDLSQFTQIADIVVAAVGKAGLVTADMIKEGAAVIDVGMNRLSSGKLAGDVVFDEVKGKAGYITPVPGGVGPMTITMLLANTLKAAERVADGEQAARRATA